MPRLWCVRTYRRSSIDSFQSARRPPDRRSSDRSQSDFQRQRPLKRPRSPREAPPSHTWVAPNSELNELLVGVFARAQSLNPVGGRRDRDPPLRSVSGDSTCRPPCLTDPGIPRGAPATRPSPPPGWGSSPGSIAARAATASSPPERSRSCGGGRRTYRSTRVVLRHLSRPIASGILDASIVRTSPARTDHCR